MKIVNDFSEKNLQILGKFKFYWRIIFYSMIVKEKIF